MYKDHRGSKCTSTTDKNGASAKIGRQNVDRRVKMDLLLDMFPPL